MGSTRREQRVKRVPYTGRSRGALMATTLLQAEAGTANPHRSAPKNTGFHDRVVPTPACSGRGVSAPRPNLPDPPPCPCPSGQRLIFRPFWGRKQLVAPGAMANPIYGVAGPWRGPRWRGASANSPEGCKHDIVRHRVAGWTLPGFGWVVKLALVTGDVALRLPAYASHRSTSRSRGQKAVRSRAKRSSLLGRSLGRWLCCWAWSTMIGATQSRSARASLRNLYL